MIRRLLYSGFALKGAPVACSLEAASRNPLSSQIERLTAIVQGGTDSSFGGDHGFASIKTVRDFQRQVPIRDYEAIRPYIDRISAGETRVLTSDDPFMFATTSGTLGHPKYIPITEGYLDEFRRASISSGYHLFKEFPGIKQGVTLSIASSAEEGRTAGGIPYGAISGCLFLREPTLLRKYISPIPYEVYLIPDWESRYYTLLRLALNLPLTCFYTLNPSTIIMLARKLHQYRESLIKDVAEGTIRTPKDLPSHTARLISGFLEKDKGRASALEKLASSNSFVPHRIWPMLQVVSCWTRAAAAFYLDDFPDLFDTVPIRDITYGASEGRGSVYIGNNRQLLAIRSHFFEFIPESEMGQRDPSVLLSHELQEGQNYYILFTTSGGLYRYNINDVVKVVGFHHGTPLIEFQYKGGNITSFTGEKVTELQVTRAMSQSLQELSLRAAYFTVIPEFRPHPHYQLWIEPATDEHVGTSWTSLTIDELSRAFDRHLGLLNIEYQAKRDSQRLSPVTGQQIQAGSYEQLRCRLTQSGVADSQIKLSHLNPKPEIKVFLGASHSAL